MDFEYYFPFLLMIFGAIWQFISYRNLSFLYGFIIVYIIFLSGMRDRVGPDWPGYEQIFFFFRDNYGLSVNFLKEAYGMEVGFIWFNKIIAELGFELWVFNLSYAAIAVYLKSKIILEYAKYTFLAFALYYVPYYFFEEIIQIRQGFSVALVLFSFKYVVERNLFKFLFTIFIATNFHISSVIFVIGYWLYKIRIPKILMIVLLIVSIGLSQTNFLGYISPILKLTSGASYSLMKGLSYLNEGGSEGFGFSYADVSRAIFVLILVMFKDYLTERDSMFNGLINYVFLGSFFFYAFKSEPIYSARLTSHFIAFSYIVFPRMLYFLRPSKTYFTVAFLGLSLYSVLIYFRFVSIHEKTFEEYTNIIYNPSKIIENR